MSDKLAHELAALFLVFCRTSGCLMLLPGFSSVRVSPTIRLFISFAISMALFPAVRGAMEDVPALEGLPFRIISETVTGIYFGFLVRIFYLALEFGASAMANYAGYGSVFSQAIEDSHQTGPAMEAVTLTCTALFFILDLHVDVLNLLKASYFEASAADFAARVQMEAVHAAFQRSFLMTLQLCAPLLAYSIAVNFAFGLISKVVPQIPAYVVSMPFVLAGGLIIMMKTEPAQIHVFMTARQDWIGALTP